MFKKISYLWISVIVMMLLIIGVLSVQGEAVAADILPIIDATKLPPSGAMIPDVSQFGPGTIVRVPDNTGGPVPLSSSNSFVRWIRYPAEEKEWLSMKDYTAYYRDVLTGGEIFISRAVNGETWTADAVRPQGDTVHWGYVRFYDNYNGYSRAFVSTDIDGNLLWILYNTDSIYVGWYWNSQCDPTGVWKMRFYNNDALFFSGDYKVLPQINPEKVATLYNQNDYSDPNAHWYANRCWVAGSNHQKTTICGGANTEHVTIAQKGCYLTGCCMILAYHGVDVDPPTLNNYLIANGGYAGGDVIPGIVANYVPDKVFYAGSSLALPDSQRLDERNVCSMGPQLAWVRKYNHTKYHHFVTVTGEDEERTTYKINDPDGASQILLSSKYNDIHSYRNFQGPDYIYKQDRSEIRIPFHSPGELLIVDPQGNRLGYDPIAGKRYNEIPFGWYEPEYIEDPSDESVGEEIKVLEIMRPVEGEYQLFVTGTGEGTYEMYVVGFDLQGNDSRAEKLNIPILPDVIHKYSFGFDKTLSSGIVLDGGIYDAAGQRPRDVNKFLSYSNISGTHVALPLGTTSFPLAIVYGPDIIPGLFSATLDSTEVTNLFTAVPNSSEVVSIPVHPGRNVLKLSVSGNLDSRVARDSDQIIFLVEGGK